MMELTKRERKLAEISVKRYHGFFYKKAALLEWVGIILFLLSLVRSFSWLEPYSQSLLIVGSVIFFVGQYARFMGLIGKLYEEILRKGPA